MLTTTNSRLWTFLGGDVGPWLALDSRPVIGAALPNVACLAVVPGDAAPAAGGWRLRGVTSNERYVTTEEKRRLAEIQPPLGRPEATQAVLIPIKKRDEWWALPPDERRRIFEDRSAHVRTGMEALPAVARRLFHCRDLAEAEPFDFLTWFEFAECDTSSFDLLLARLRATEEWTYVEREAELRLRRNVPFF